MGQMIHLVIFFVIFLIVILICFFSGQSYWSSNPNHSAEHAEILKNCVTSKEYKTGAGSHILAYLDLIAFEKYTGIKILHPPYQHFEQLDDKPEEANKIRDSLGMKKEGDPNNSTCAIIDSGLPNYLQPKDKASQVQRILKQRKFLQSLYKSPDPFPKLLIKGKFNIVIHYRVINLKDERDHKYDKKDTGKTQQYKKDHADRDQIDVKTIQKLIDKVKKSGIKDSDISVHILTQKSANPKEEQRKEEFQKMKWKLHVDAPEFDCFDAMIQADALLTTHGSRFSISAGILNKGNFVFQATDRHKGRKDKEDNYSFFPVL